eukprot:4378924-Pleurochrysis_carterae.AAC.3
MNETTQEKEYSCIKGLSPATCAKASAGLLSEHWVGSVLGFTWFSARHAASLFGVQFPSQVYESHD